MVSSTTNAAASPKGAPAPTVARGQYSASTP